MHKEINYKDIMFIN